MGAKPDAKADAELMEYADGELDAGATAKLETRLAGDPDARAKIDALGHLREGVRGHLELAADAIPERRFDAMWREVDKQLGERSEPARTGVWARFSAWVDRHWGHLLTGVASAGAVAALALVLRPSSDGPSTGSRGAISIRPVALRSPPEVESLDTPDGTGTVLNLEDEDGHTTVIWVSPEDTVEGI